MMFFKKKRQVVEQQEAKILDFEHAKKIAMKLCFCSEADDLRRGSVHFIGDEHLRYAKIYFRKGIQKAFRVNGFAEDEINIILALVEAYLFSRDEEWKVAEESSSHREWYDKLNELEKKYLEEKEE